MADLTAELVALNARLETLIQNKGGEFTEDQLHTLVQECRKTVYHVSTLITTSPRSIR